MSAAATPRSLPTRPQGGCTRPAPGGSSGPEPELKATLKTGTRPLLHGHSPGVGPDPGLCTRWPLSSLASAVTFSVWLRDAPERTVLLPDELPGQLDVHVHLADPGEATANAP